MIHSMSSATSASRASLSPRPIAAKKSFTVWTFCSVLIGVSPILCDAGSDLRHASIDGEIHAGDERTFIGGEECDGSRDFLWLAPATHWDLGGKLGGRLLGLLSGKARRCLQ